MFTQALHTCADKRKIHLVNIQISESRKEKKNRENKFATANDRKNKIKSEHLFHSEDTHAYLCA